MQNDLFLERSWARWIADRRFRWADVASRCPSCCRVRRWRRCWPQPSARVRAFLQTAYASGLRLSELCGLRICDIDSAPDRMCIRVVHGKGGQGRYALLSADLLAHLRQYWRDCRRGARGSDWLFPAHTDASRPARVIVANQLAAFTCCDIALPRICSKLGWISTASAN